MGRELLAFVREREGEVEVVGGRFEFCDGDFSQVVDGGSCYGGC